MLRRTVTACLAGVLSAVLVLSAPARAVWFGAPDVSHLPNVTVTCAYYPAPIWYPMGTTSCTWFTIAGFGETNPLRSNIVPKGIGSITAFRISTGVSTGQMRLTILKTLRAYANAGETACCVGDDQSPIVTPPPNATTTYRLARPIPVYNGPESSTIESFDSIAISLLDLRSTVPAYLSSAYVTGAVLYPFVSPGQERFGGALTLPTGELATRGYQVLLQADWEPASGVAVPTGTVRVNRGAAVVPLACRLDVRCPGVLRLQNVRPKGAVAARTTTYGSASFSIAAGRKHGVTVRLSSAGRKLTAGRRSHQMWANVTLKLGSQTFTSARRITVRP